MPIIDYILKYWKSAAIIASLLLGLFAIPSFVFTWWMYEDNKGPKNIEAKFTKFNKHDSNIVIGRIINKDSIHADKLKLMCKYTGTIKDIIDDPKVQKNHEGNVITIDVEKLVIGQTCKIDLVGNKEFEIKDNIKLAWGTGRVISVPVVPPTPNEDDLMQSIDKAGMRIDKSIGTYQKNNQLTVAR